METVVILLIAGAVLVFLETILPGLIAGIVGLCCLVAGVALSYRRFGMFAGNVTLLCTLLGVIIMIGLYLRFFPTSRMARVFISQRQVGDLEVDRSALLHQTGTALTTLRPSGAARIDGQRVDVVAEGPMVEKGELVKVITVEGSRVVVRKITKETS